MHEFTLYLTPDPDHRYAWMNEGSDITIESDSVGGDGLYVVGNASGGFWTNEDDALALRDALVERYGLPARTEQQYGTPEAIKEIDAFLGWGSPEAMDADLEARLPKVGDRVRILHAEYLPEMTGETGVIERSSLGIDSPIRVYEGRRHDFTVRTERGSVCFAADVEVLPAEEQPESTSVLDSEGDFWVEVEPDTFALVLGRGDLGAARVSLNEIEEDYGIDDGGYDEPRVYEETENGLRVGDRVTQDGLLGMGAGTGGEVVGIPTPTLAEVKVDGYTYGPGCSRLTNVGAGTFSARMLTKAEPFAQVGDRVKVGPNPGTRPEPGAGYVDPYFRNIEGEVVATEHGRGVRVKGVTQDGRTLTQYVHPAHLTKVEPKPKFAVGDRVRVIGNSEDNTAGTHSLAIGSTAEVVNPAPVGHPGTVLVRGRVSQWVKVEDLEAVEEKPAPRRVRVTIEGPGEGVPVGTFTGDAMVPLHFTADDTVTVEEIEDEAEEECIFGGPRSECSACRAADYLR